MGRPVKRDVLGTLVFGDYTTTAAGIKATAYFGGESRSDVFIVKQKGAKSYFVQDKSDSTQAQCKLVETLGTTEGTMVLTGYTAGGPDASATPIAKLMKRTAIDFNGVRYTWFLDNDSSGDQIILTAITA
jgi:hypothetical protein